ncbi:MAG: type III pantothenate kinase [Elusimicrobiota bacterium]
MLLTIDIGNTNITLGVFRLKNGKAVQKPFKIWRLETNKNKTADEYGIKILDLFHYDGLDAKDVDAVAIASVVPDLDGSFKQMVRKYFKSKAFFATYDKKMPVKVHYGDISEMGADRLANAAAAYRMYKKAVIVIDFGTATTFDCINAKGEYIGGVIAPGPRIAAEALAKKTAKLPMVDIVKPARVIGRSTIACIQSGVYFGYVGLIREILKLVKRDMRGNPVVVATGGLSGTIIKEIKEIKREIPELTLEGIRIIWDNNRKAQGC